MSQSESIIYTDRVVSINEAETLMRQQKWDEKTIRQILSQPIPPVILCGQWRLILKRGV